MSSGGDVTQLLAQWSRGDCGALDSLMPIVYSELRKIADAYLRRERTGHTLQPTALVHEAWLRLAKQNEASMSNRKQFFALAAQIMRRILVDHARGFQAEKRGGGEFRLPLNDTFIYSENRADEFLALDQALTNLAGFSPRMAQVIELRYFAGFKVEEAAEMLGVSIATVSREQHAAEAWLSHNMSDASLTRTATSEPD